MNVFQCIVYDVSTIIDGKIKSKRSLQNQNGKHIFQNLKSNKNFNTAPLLFPVTVKLTVYL